MKTSYLLLLILFVSTPNLLRAGNIEESFSLDIPVGVLKGTLLIPNDNERPPLVIIIAGSGPTDRDCNQFPALATNSFKYLAEDLAGAGIASFRYDKRGVGASVCNFREEEVVFEDFIDDAVALTEKLLMDRRFGNVFLAGHSEGALIALEAAQRTPDIKGVISISGSGRPMDEILKEQLADVPSPWRELLYSYIDTLKTGEIIDDVPQDFYSLFRPSVQPFLISNLKYDPAVSAGRMKQQLLILQGSTDIQVSITDAKLLSDANKSARKVLIENMNHVLKECDTLDKAEQMKSYTDPENKNHPQLCSEIINFVMNNQF